MKQHAHKHIHKDMFMCMNIITKIYEAKTCLFDKNNQIAELQQEKRQDTEINKCQEQEKAHGYEYLQLRIYNKQVYAII